MAYSVNAVANSLIMLSRKSGDSLSLMRLQKLMYYVQGWHLALTGEPLFNEFIEAWEYGPIVARLYYELKNSRSDFLTKPLVSFDLKSQIEFIEFIPVEDIIPSAILTKVYTVYRPYSTIQLANMTHDKNSPWEVTLNQSGPMIRRQIDNELLRDYFRWIAKK